MNVVALDKYEKSTRSDGNGSGVTSDDHQNILNKNR